MQLGILHLEFLTAKAGSPYPGEQERVLRAPGIEVASRGERARDNHSLTVFRKRDPRTQFFLPFLLLPRPRGPTML